MAKKKDAVGITSTKKPVTAEGVEKVEQSEDNVYGSPTSDNDLLPQPRKPRVQRPMVHKQDHINIDCNVTMMDGKKTSRRVKIMNPEGCMVRSQVNNPEGVFQTLFALLVSKYGLNHIK